MSPRRAVGRLLVSVAAALLISVMPVGSATAGPAAAELPPGLTSAVGRDLRLEPQEYLRRVELAQRLADFAASLDRRFPDAVAGTWLDPQGRAVVAIRDAAEGAREAVRQRGFLAVDESATPELAAVSAVSMRELLMDAASDSTGDRTVGGDRYIAGKGLCSWAFNAIDSAGLPAAVTAGHCNEAAEAGEPVTDEQQTFTPLPGPIAGAPTGTFEKAIVDGIRDYSIVRIAGEARNSFDNNLVRAGQSTIAITGVGVPVVGEPVCKSGATSGFTCGIVTRVDQPDPQRPPIRFMHSALSLPGDSGGALISGTLAMGIVSQGGYSDEPTRFPSEKPGTLPTFPSNPLTKEFTKRLAAGDFQSFLEQLGPLADQLVRAVPGLTMIAQSVADVLAENPGLQLRTQ
ncbi:S1 family peptidase [Nocardia inohanensis]|uniref:S1 family peptidase n=1 Tax=Nocardia inohanensis TaxID=209246 RepID=UPI000AF4607C|nr:S1 family peptidase [Nocardia inohanensis]